MLVRVEWEAVAGNSSQPQPAPSSGSAVRARELVKTVDSQDFNTWDSSHNLNRKLSKNTIRQSKWKLYFSSFFLPLTLELFSGYIEFLFLLKNNFTVFLLYNNKNASFSSHLVKYRNASTSHIWMGFLNSLVGNALLCFFTQCQL